uniref:Trafficking protein particle complex subunit 6B n=1 Tax=Prymnesium polylepis TaxID=72548 RepID=A0A7S4M9V0_9EUKA|mmetsp:Transcript_22818/g.56396  ORF Transcript_22818/g.56396 Transcript_22818/m.56396 type:complete len:155 (+) Transcript_22818:1-465(+)
MELVQMVIGDVSDATPMQLQRAGRKIESVGFQVGQRLAERYTKDSPRFTETLDIIKFICKDFWFEIYRKQIDKLQTNNRGVYMLQDNRNRLLSRCSPSSERRGSAKQVAALYARFPAGLIRGALSGLNVSASVSVEVGELPACQFTVKIQSEAK